MRFRGTSIAVLALVFAASAQAGISAVAAQPSVSSVRISWRSDRPATRSAVQIGLTADYGIWSPLVSGANPNVTIGGLEPATTYRFRIGAFTGAFTTQAIPASTSAGISPSSVILGGQPFFPRMVFQQCPYL